MYCIPITDASSAPLDINVDFVFLSVSVLLTSVLAFSVLVTTLVACLCLLELFVFVAFLFAVLALQDESLLFTFVVTVLFVSCLEGILIGSTSCVLMKGTCFLVDLLHEIVRHYFVQVPVSIGIALGQLNKRKIHIVSCWLVFAMISSLGAGVAIVYGVYFFKKCLAFKQCPIIFDTLGGGNKTMHGQFHQQRLFKHHRLTEATFGW